jgi:hypothetical protein
MPGSWQGLYPQPLYCLLCKYPGDACAISMQTRQLVPIRRIRFYSNKINKGIAMD